MKDKISKVGESLRKYREIHLDLGYIASLAGSSEYHQKYQVGTLLYTVMPALQHKQYKIFFDGIKPIGFVSWAYLNEKTEALYQAGDYILQPKDWKRGDRLWIHEFLVPDADKYRNKMIEDLKKDKFINDVVKVLVRDEDGSVKKVMSYHGNNVN